MCMCSSSGFLSVLVCIVAFPANVLGSAIEAGSATYIPCNSQLFVLLKSSQTFIRKVRPPSSSDSRGHLPHLDHPKIEKNNFNMDNKVEPSHAEEVYGAPRRKGGLMNKLYPPGPQPGAKGRVKNHCRKFWWCG